MFYCSSLLRSIAVRNACTTVAICKLMLQLIILSYKCYYNNSLIDTALISNQITMYMLVSFLNPFANQYL